MSDKPISDEFLEVLRCPVAVHYEKTDENQHDPGRLRLVKNTWLVCDDSGYKYPIRQGIPVMLPEVGLKYKEIPESELPDEPPDED